MGVAMPELEQLRQNIRLREWMDNAKRGLASRSITLHGLSDVMEEASRMGATESNLYKDVTERIDAVQVCCVPVLLRGMAV